MAELSLSQEKTILSNMLLEWQASQYQFKISYDIAQMLGDPQPRLDSIRQELERCQKAINHLRDRLVELEKKADKEQR